MTKCDVPVMGDGPGMFKMIHDTAPCIDEDVSPDDSGEWSIICGDTFTTDPPPTRFWVRHPARWAWVPVTRTSASFEPGGPQD
jgi:hypothetical protein